MTPAAPAAPCSVIVPPLSVLIPSSNVSCAAAWLPLTVIESAPVASPPDAPVPAENTAVSPLFHATGVPVPSASGFQNAFTPQIPLAGEAAVFTAPGDVPLMSQ